MGVSNKVTCPASFSISLLIVCVILHIPVGALAVTDSTTISIPINLTTDIGEYKFPYPFDNWKIYVKFQNTLNPNLLVRYSSDKDIVSPGESVTLRLEVAPTTTDVSSRIIVQLFQGTEERNKWQLELPRISIKIPGNYKSPSIPITPLSLHSFGVPLTVELVARAEVVTEMPIMVRAEKLTPIRQTVSIKENSLGVSSTFTKVDGLGARLILDSAGLSFDGRFYISLRIRELPFVKYDFPPITFLTLSTESSIGKELLKLKTPITISVSSAKESVAPGEALSIYGKIVPQVEGVKIEVRARKSGGNWLTIASTSTTSGGSFMINWVPTEAGDYEISAYHAGGEYTIETWSTNTIKIRVYNPNEFLIGLLVVIATAFGVAMIIRRRRY
jgi:hypothetical protein